MYIGNSGLDNIAFPSETWEAGVKRVKINFGGRKRGLAVDTIHSHSALSNIGKEDIEERIENDPDWVEERDVSSLKGVWTSFQPNFTEDEISNLWKKLGDAIGEGKTARIVWPLVQILATRR